MCAITPAEVSHADRPSPLVDRMLHLAGAHADQTVSVAGPASLAALIALCRQGFDRVSCARQATCQGADEASDVLMISGPCTAQALTDVLGRTARLLKDGGVLVVHEADLDDDQLIRATLAGLGCQTDWCVHDLADACLVAFKVTRQPAQVQRLAA
jgi:hypothetical protein